MMSPSDKPLGSRFWTQQQEKSLRSALGTVEKVLPGLERAREFAKEWLSSIESAEPEEEVKEKYDAFADQLLPSERAAYSGDCTTSYLTARLLDQLERLLRPAASTSGYDEDGSRQRAALTAMKKRSRGAVWTLPEATADTLFNTYAAAVSDMLISEEDAVSQVVRIVEAIQGVKTADVHSGKLTGDLRALFETLVNSSYAASLSLHEQLTTLLAIKAGDATTAARCCEAMKEPYKDLLALYATVEAYRGVLPDDDDSDEMV